MPYKFTTPVATADVVEIERIEIFPAGPRIEVYLRYGRRMADGSVRPGQLSQVSLVGARATALATQKPDGVIGMYENIKRLLYADLMAAGDLSGGSTT